MLLLMRDGAVNPLKRSNVRWLHFEVFSAIHIWLTFLIFDIRSLWRSRLSARVPECQKLKSKLDLDAQMLTSFKRLTRKAYFRFAMDCCQIHNNHLITIHNKSATNRTSTAPLAFNAFGTICVKFCMEVKGWLMYKMAKKYCRKFQPLWVGRTNVTEDRQTTDGFGIAKTRT